MKLTSLSPVEKKLGWFYWAFQLLLLPVVLSMLNDHFGAPLNATELNLLFLILNFLLLAVILLRFLSKSCVAGLTRPFRTLWWAILGAAGYMLCNYGVRCLLARYQPDFVNFNDQTIFAMAEEYYTLTLMATVVLAPVAEELLYRGIIFGTMDQRNRLLAYVVSTVLFAAVHVVGYITSYDIPTLLLCFVQYLPAGLCLGLAYSRSGSILSPILAHVLINYVVLTYGR